MKSKGKKERYTHLYAEFHIKETRKPSSMISAKKQRKTIEWKTRDIFKKIGDTKGTIHAKTGSKTDINDMDLTEAEDIKKRQQEYMKNYTKKTFMTQIIMTV